MNVDAENKIPRRNGRKRYLFIFEGLSSCHGDRSIDRSVLSQKEERCRQAVWILVLKSSIKMRTFIFFSRQKPVLPGAFEMCISQKTRHSRKIP